MLSYILIAIGSALGGTARFWLSTYVAERVDDPFPWGTLLINVTGSFAIGLFATLAEPDGRLDVPEHWRQFFMIGICGGYTTFSAFSLQTLVLAMGGEWFRAGAYILASVALCLLGVWLGHAGALLIND